MERDIKLDSGGSGKMRIYTDDSTIETENNDIKFNNIVLNVSRMQPAKVLKIICDYEKVKKAGHVVIESKQNLFSKADVLVLIAIGLYHLHIFCNDESKNYAVTFSYNFPINLEPKLIVNILENIDLIVKARLIVLGEAEDFIRVDVSKDDMYEAFFKRNKDLIKRNDRNFIISRNYSIESVLNSWKAYCYKKFNRVITTNEIEAYKKIYTLSGFSTLTYLIDGEIVAQGVIFVSDESNTMYYCIFSWDEKYKKKSPGIYAYCKAIQKCHEKGLNFSFCYGLQQYKTKLLTEFLH